ESPVTTKRKEAERRYQDGLALLKAGNQEDALVAFSDALVRDPSYEPARQQCEALKQELLARYLREGARARAHQDLEVAIAKYDQALLIDPTNDQARVKKAEALYLMGKYKDLTSK